MQALSFPNESKQYRRKRNELLAAEIALREQIEAVAQLRRGLPRGGQAPDYLFATAAGEASWADLFGEHDTLIVYSYMYGGLQTSPCPMCSAFLDSLVGQLQHITAHTSFVVVSRIEIDQIEKLQAARGWLDIPWVSAAGNTYPVDYQSEMPNGAQLPMSHVFMKDGAHVYHHWSSEMFFAASDYHPRHNDMIWPLWHLFDLLPQGRADFMPKLNYADS